MLVSKMYRLASFKLPLKVSKVEIWLSQYLPDTRGQLKLYAASASIIATQILVIFKLNFEALFVIS